MRKHERSFPCLFFLFLSLVSLHLPLFADTSSANYKVSEERVVSGSASLTTSTNYKVDNGTLDYAAKTTASSNSYSLQGKIGIDGASPVPVINSVTPGDFSRKFTDESPSFTVSAVSPDSQAITYEAKQDGVLKDGPQSTNVLTWALVSGDKGRRTVTLNVSDATGITRKDQSLYAFRRPVK